MPKMEEEDRKELLTDVTDAVNSPDTKIFLSLMLDSEGNLQRRGFVNGAGSLEVIAILGELLESCCSMAEMVGDPFDGLVETLQKMKKTTELGKIMFMMNKIRESREEPTPEDDDKPFDFNFDIPGGK